MLLSCYHAACVGIVWLLPEEVQMRKLFLSRQMLRVLFLERFHWLAAAWLTMLGVQFSLLSATGCEKHAKIINLTCQLWRNTKEVYARQKKEDKKTHTTVMPVQWAWSCILAQHKDRKQEETFWFTPFTWTNWPVIAHKGDSDPVSQEWMKKNVIKH